MAKVTRKQICQAFKDAVPLLARSEEDITWYSCSRGGPNKEEFICLALSPSVISAASNAARQVITDRIGHTGSLKAWVSDQGLCDYSRITVLDMQTYRHRWLQALIEEFSG